MNIETDHIEAGSQKVEELFQAHKFDMKNRKILVVGGGSPVVDEPLPINNGGAISLLCAMRGAVIAVADINKLAADNTVAFIESAKGIAVGIQADVTNESGCEALVADAIKSLGGLDGLVLNVGIGQGLFLEGTTVKMWDDVMSVNLRAHFIISKLALPNISSGGSIVYTSSVAGLKPGTCSPSYDTSKAALFGLCRHVAFEGAGRQVRANALVPGLIDSAMGRLASEHSPIRNKIRVPIGRQGTVQEVARAAAFLLSEEASYITGQMLVVDGGLSLI
jgi:NAD(P)-dependent dehydrogenase (short-subunit alcohol dehydrogenase family)